MTPGELEKVCGYLERIAEALEDKNAVARRGELKVEQPETFYNEEQPEHGQTGTRRPKPAGRS